MTSSSAISQAPVWNAADYAANSTQQQAWARELIARLKLRGDERVLDVGCGDGKVTAEIARALPGGSAVGIDASPQMIEFARQTFPAGQVSNLEFRVMDARKIRLEEFSKDVLQTSPAPPQKEKRAGERRPKVLKSDPLTPTLSPLRRGEGVERAWFDIVFSNAALHWISDHDAFLRGAAGCLRPGGRLVTSCGGQGNAQDIFVALRPVMRQPRWRDCFRKMETPYFFYAPEDYQQWLPDSGFRAGQVRLAPKDAVYEGRAGFAAVLRTTWLPYTQRVPESLREEFIAAIVERYIAKHPPDVGGRVHVRMVRLEIDAVKV